MRLSMAALALDAMRRTFGGDPGVGGTDAPTPATPMAPRPIRPKPKRQRLKFVGEVAVAGLFAQRR